MTSTLRRYHQRRTARRAAALRLVAARHAQTGRVVRHEPQSYELALLPARRP